MVRMVKVCSHIYPKSGEPKYEQHYAKSPYPLHDFQKWCVEAIVEGHHVLACCPTGSGKTFGGEFALDYFHSKQKKTIYCSPIKALSNQKYYDFTRKFPHISVGLITGDIKTNPEADVLIMTTEILMNKLYQLASHSPVPKSAVSFEMDINKELGCVVFDEIHMIADEARGHVWEQSIMLLPDHVQIVGLSATLDDPEKFAYWLETRNSKTPDKTVYLTTKLERSVPLTHYHYLTTHSGVFKHIKDKALQQEINATANQLHVIQSAKGVYNEAQNARTNKVLKLFADNNIRVHRQHVLNSVAELLVQKEMLPALCYVFSRKQLERCAREITVNLLEFDSKVPYTVDRECEQIIRKLPNYQEYLRLPEYQEMVQLLRKGVGMHHAGLMPVIREMVELLFAKGFIKILFCTETMSVGINLPVKTTVFTDINKFDGVASRMLYGHEYTQAAGRAGRLGLDTVGHVIHLNNLFRDVDATSYKTMLKGQPHALTSNFKISPNLMLNLIDTGNTKFGDFARRSMVTNELDSQLGAIYAEINKLEKDLHTLSIKTPQHVVDDFARLLSQKQNKALLRQIRTMETEYRDIRKIVAKQEEIRRAQSQFANVENYIDDSCAKMTKLLTNDGFIDANGLLPLGQIAMHIREVNCLAFAKLMERIERLSTREMVGLFSCFTNVRVSEDLKTHCVTDNPLIETATRLNEQYSDDDMVYDLLPYVGEWCDAATEQECKLVLQKIGAEKEIFLGEFVKALLKINNITNELEKVAELTGNMEFLSKLREIPVLTLKFVVTNQSLYI
jgi:superfamily II RNA helicase